MGGVTADRAQVLTLITSIPGLMHDFGSWLVAQKRKPVTPVRFINEIRQLW